MATNNITNNTIDKVVKDTAPQLGGNLDNNTFNIAFSDNKGIIDAAGNETLYYRQTASAINYLQIANAAINTNPTIQAVGDDATIGINMTLKGTSAGLEVKNSSTSVAGRLHLFEAPTNGTNFIAHSSIDNLSSNQSIRWGSNMSITFQNFTASAYVVNQGGVTSASAALSSFALSTNPPVLGWTQFYYHNGSTSMWPAFNTLTVTPYVGKGNTTTALSTFVTDRFFSNAGVAGTGTSTGFATSNDVLYCFPIYLVPSYYDNFVIGIQTADAGGTADIDVGIYSLTANNLNSVTANTLVGSRLVNCGTILNVSTTGEKTLSFTSTFLGGWNWIGVRTDNITTALSLGISPNLTGNNFLFFLSGTVASAGATVTSEAPPYGVYFNTMTSLPTDLSNNGISGIITDAVGMCLQAL